MSDLALTKADVDRVKACAYKAKDDAEHFEDHETYRQMETLIEFCDVLTGYYGTVESFLRDQDMFDGED